MKHFLILLIIGITMAGCSNRNDNDLINKSARIHKAILTLDSHTDTPLRISRGNYDLTKLHYPEKEGGLLDFPRMQVGGLDAVFFAVFIGQGELTAEGYSKAGERADKLFKSIKTSLEKSDSMAHLALTADDAEKISGEGKAAVYIGVENGYPIGTDISKLKGYYDEGARYITLCHVEDNQICASSTDEDSVDEGLSQFGKKVVNKMNEIGMIVDVSHVSDSSFFNVLKLSKAPVIASHSCARALREHPRNLSDQMLKALAEKDGVIQVCLMSEYLKKMPENPERVKAYEELRTKYNGFKGLSEDEMKKAREKWHQIDKKYPQKLASVSDLVDHIDHIVEVAGIEHVGIGSDFDGGGELKD